LAGVSKNDKDWGKWKTPTTRGLVGREPYMHDGSEATLEAVVEYYDRGGTKNRNLSDRIKPLGLATGEKADLVAFLRPLPGEEAPSSGPRSTERDAALRVDEERRTGEEAVGSVGLPVESVDGDGPGDLVELRPFAAAVHLLRERCVCGDALARKHLPDVDGHE